MTTVQEVRFGASDPVPMAPGLLTPLPWPNWSARIRSLDVDGVHADYVELDPYEMDVPPLEDRAEQPVRMMLAVILTGTSIGQVEGQRVTLSPKQAAIVDGRARIHFRAEEPVRAVRLFVELSHLPEHLLRSPNLPVVRLKRTPLVTGCVGLISGLLQVNNPEVEPHDEEAVSAPLIALLVSLLDQARLCVPVDADSQGASLPDVLPRRTQIEAYIDLHLAEPALTVNSIAVALGLHIRTLHAAYEGVEQTVGGEIRRRRLERAQTLLGMREDRPSIEAVARRVGLTRDQLNRLFGASTGSTARRWWEEHGSRGRRGIGF